MVTALGLCVKWPLISKDEQKTKFWTLWGEGLKRLRVNLSFMSHGVYIVRITKARQQDCGHTNKVCRHWVVHHYRHIASVQLMFSWKLNMHF